MAVAIVGYRTYPDGTVNDQIDDLKAADAMLTEKFPELHERPTSMSSKEWIGKMLVGHSSGAHICSLWMVEEIESHFQTNQSDCRRSPMFDKFISLAPVTSISQHFIHEAGRGVEEISPMKPACYCTKSSFDNCSPAERILQLKGRQPSGGSSKSISTRILFVHGVEDDTVPFMSTQNLVRAIKDVAPTIKCEEYYPNAEHAEIVTDLMLGGETKEIVKRWLDDISSTIENTE